MSHINCPNIFPLTSNLFLPSLAPFDRSVPTRFTLERSRRIQPTLPAQCLTASPNSNHAVTRVIASALARRITVRTDPVNPTERAFCA